MELLSCQEFHDFGRIYIQFVSFRPGVKIVHIYLAKNSLFQGKIPGFYYLCVIL